MILAHDRAVRRALRRERVFRDPLDPLAVSDEHLLRYYRFPRRELQWLCDVLEPHIGPVTRRSHAVPCHTQVLVALRFYASGSFQSVLGDSSHLSQASVSRIIRVTDVLYRKSLREIKMPRQPHEVRQTKEKFYRKRNFPGVIGAIDGTHIPITAPDVDEDIYVNRKNYNYLNLQVVCNADNLILDYCNRFPGSTHDAYIWHNSTICRRFQDREFGNSYLIGKCCLYVFR